MKTKNLRLVTLFIFVVIGFIAYILYNSVLKDDTKSLNLIYYFTAYTSVFGLIVAYIQITSVHQQTRELNTARKTEQKRLSNLLYISDLARGLKLIEDAQIHIRYNKPEITHLRLKEIKAILFKAGDISDLIDLTDVKSYTKIKNQLTADILNVHEHIRGVKPNINFAIIDKDLEDITDILIRFEGKLKTI